MTYLAASDSLAYLAAQLAMLALRAGVSVDLPLASDRVLLAPSLVSVTIEEATRHLVALPKPLLCRAFPSNGVLAVNCHPLAGAEPHEYDWYRVTRAESAKHGGEFGYLDERYGSSVAHPVLVLGRGEALQVPSEVVAAWYRDYEIRGVDSVGDDVANPLVTTDLSYREARRRGAHGLLRFSSPADAGGGFLVTLTPPPTEPAVTEQEGSDAYFTEMAHHFHQRLLIERTVDSARLAERSRRAAQAHASDYRRDISRIAAQMRRFYAARPVPLEVAAFLEECRHHSWCRPQN